MSDLSRPGPLSLGQCMACALALGGVIGVAAAALCFAPSEMALRFALGMIALIAAATLGTTAATLWLRLRGEDLR